MRICCCLLLYKLCNNWWLRCHHESCCCLAYLAVVCAGGIRQISDIGGMRDWWLAIVVCLVLVVSVSLGPAVCESCNEEQQRLAGNSMSNVETLL